MRVAVFERFLHTQDEALIIAEIVEAIAHAQLGNPDSLLVLDTLSTTLAKNDTLDYDARANLYSEAKRQGSDAVARMFFTASAKTLETIKLEGELGETRAVDPRGRQLTLGERKTYARTHDRKLIGKMLKEPHPAVIEILLDNPHITESDVLVIASRRPALPAVLELVAINERWRPRYAIRRALVLNPHTPAHLTVRLMAMLRRKDLVEAAGDSNLAQSVRDQARALLGSAQKP